MTPFAWLGFAGGIDCRLLGIPSEMMSSKSRSSSLPLSSSLHSADWTGSATGALTADWTETTSTFTSASSFRSFDAADAARFPTPRTGGNLAVLITSPSTCSELKLVQRVNAGLSSSLNRRAFNPIKTMSNFFKLEIKQVVPHRSRTYF